MIQFQRAHARRRLHRWGYQTYRQLFNARQLVGLNKLVSSLIPLILQIYKMQN